MWAECFWAPPKDLEKNASLVQFGPSIWLWIILTYEVWEDMCMEISADRVVVAVVVAGGDD